MSDIQAIRRQLKIKSGVVKRLFKEVDLYRKEIKQCEAKKLKLQQDSAEEWDIKNSSKLIEESKKMVVDTGGRLEKAMEDLETLINRAKEESGIREDEELVKAEKILQEAKTG